jgi:N6-L-threonylcarbamoyladenine synthase
VAANFLEPEPLDPPFLCLIASGGHTLLAAVREPSGFEILGETLDDAAGEALDKGARLLGLGYPGGPAIQRLAEGGDPGSFEFPVAMTRDPRLDFSFSGLKTALLYAVRDLDPAELERRRADLAAAYQEAVVGQLVSKLTRALDAGDWQAVALGGGVAANRPLRERVTALCAERSLRLKLVPGELCTDNAAMIAAAAEHVEASTYPEYLALDVGRMSAAEPARVTLYGRPECHLCDAARGLLAELAGSPPRFDVLEVDIEADEELLARYLERIPVVEFRGQIIGELVLDPDSTRARLATLLE